MGLFDALLPEARYVGEIGLYGGNGLKNDWDVQYTVFRHMLNAVNLAVGRTMPIHSCASSAAVQDEPIGIDGTQ
ncbi:MAG TPA: hypothetical protein DCZ03_15565 [Gammaproteobacteria bacterium]|nr:hypothetical protein [Gammaproteobacteria bacterium]